MNATLVATSSGVAAGSLHVAGMAVDIRVPGRPLRAVRDAAKALRAGGVGYYPDSERALRKTLRVAQST